jgi:hypothetical protein
LNSTNGSDHEIDLKFLRIFDNTEGAAISIVKRDATKSFKLKKAGELVIKAISHVNGADKESGEIEVNIQGTQAEKNFESDMVIHNHAVNFEYLDNDQLFQTAKKRKSPDSRAVHTGATVNHLVEYVKVSDYCQLNTDAATAYIGDTTYDDTSLDFTNVNASTPDKYIQWVNNRTALASQGYVVAKAAVETYGNANQAVLEFTTDIENALPRHIGDNYSIDMADFFPTDYTPTIPYSVPADYTDGNAQLIETECDFITGQATIKMFMRGD